MYVTGRGTDGQGTILPALAQASTSLPIESVTVAATSPDNAAVVERCVTEINRRLGTPLNASYRLLSDLGDWSEFDCAIVCVPDHLHCDFGLRVFEAGLHCMMVKPLTPTAAEARELITAQRAAGVHAMVEFHKRFDEANLVVKRMLDEGALGRLVYATVEYSQRIQVPLELFSGWADKTNIFQYLGVHYVDLMAFLTGFEPIRVMAHGTRGVLSSRGVDTFDSVHALVEWRAPDRPDQTFTAQYAINWIDADASSAMSDQKYLVVGERGRIQCDQKNRGLQVVNGAGVADVNPYFTQYLADGDRQRVAGYGPASIIQFARDVADLRASATTAEQLATVRPTFEETMPATLVVDAANRSLGQDGAWISIGADVGA